MAKEREAAITPAESLDGLPKLAYDPERSGEETEFRRAELLQSDLEIARMDQGAESQVVRDAVRAALGKVPEVGE
jgi:hypothetical protein